MSNPDIDKIMKQGLEKMLSEVQVPDASKAYKKLKKRRRTREIKFQAAAFAAAVIVLIIIVLPGSAQAFRGIFSKTITWMMSETSQLFQRSSEGDSGDIIIVHEMKKSEYYSVEELMQDELASNFIRGPLGVGQFVFAEAVRNPDGQLARLSIDFIHNEKVIRFIAHAAKTAAIIVDIEDFNVTSVTVNRNEVTVFSDDKGFNMMHWEKNGYSLELNGYFPISDLEEVGKSMGVF